MGVIMSKRKSRGACTTEASSASRKEQTQPPSEDEKMIDGNTSHTSKPDQNKKQKLEVSSSDKLLDEQNECKQTPKSIEECLRPQYHKDTKLIKKPHELVDLIQLPPHIEQPQNEELFKRIAGSMLGLAIGDALGAHVEFRPHEYLSKHRVTDFQAGGTWGLEKGQFTDDTSMALCLANSLIACHDFDPYDQLVRYKWWYRHGYMSSTGECFDIGTATRQSIENFERRQRQCVSNSSLSENEMDFQRDLECLKDFNVDCSETGVAGNGALMRLAPVPLFFQRHPVEAVEYSGQSGQITHGDIKAYDACRYYGALIVAALHGYTKRQMLHRKFYWKHKAWFGEKELDPAIKEIACGSYRKEHGYEDGIRGGGYIVKALEAALWAFWSTKTFEEGACAAVNLGDDTDTTAAIYGQLAGAFYTMDQLPKKWVKKVYGREFIMKISKLLQYEGEDWYMRKTKENDSSPVAGGKADQEADQEKSVSQEPKESNQQTSCNSTISPGNEASSSDIRTAL